MIKHVGPSINPYPFILCSYCGAVIIPGFGRWHILDFDGALHVCASLPETGGTIQECARCVKSIWIEPDGSKSEYGLRPIVNSQGEIVKIDSLGQMRESHRCPGRYVAPLPSRPIIPDRPLEHEQHETGMALLSELGHIIDKPPTDREET